MTAFGDSLDALISEIRRIEEDVLPEKAMEIMLEATEHGAKEMARLLDDSPAFTGTGIARVESGKGEYPGRHVDGTMIDAVTWDVVDLGDTLIGSFGWINPDDYFLYQDWGTANGHVPAAHSLRNAFLQTDLLFASLVKAAAN